jgi:hypothetical protein
VILIRLDCAAHRKLVADGLSLHRLIHSFFNSKNSAWDDESKPTPVDLGGYQVCIQKLDTDFRAIFHRAKSRNTSDGPRVRTCTKVTWR